jgi:tRNA(Ile2) C34 agmatinyltransferase TiaS
MTRTSAERLLRHVYPCRSACPACGGSTWQRAGSQGRKVYRRCKACGETYSVLPLAAEYDLGGSTSVMRLA